MNLITLENITKSYSEKILLNDIKLNITDEDKIGIIGINGAGKSTLLKIIAGVETCDSGNITKMNGLRIQYLAQEVTYNEEHTIMEAVFNGNSEIMSVIREYENITMKLSQNPTDENLQNKLFKLNTKMDALNGWQIESNAKAILNKLGITNYNEIMRNLSGGQRKRVALCNTLITPCDLLILDEPTNHMDNDLIDYLEELLKSIKTAVIMITHDRYFLDRVTNKIIELDKGNLYTYIGNYSEFLLKKIDREALNEAFEKKRQSLFKKELAWIKRGAKARSTKQKARIQRFEEIRDGKLDLDKSKVAIDTVSSRLGKKVIEINHINKSYDDNKLIKNFSYIVTKDDKIGIVGKNGVGKSTLLNILSGKLEPDSGKIDVGITVKFGYFTQENTEMNPELKVIDYIKEVAEYVTTKDDYKVSASQMLERFLFEGSMQHTLISKLSGGEKRRLYLLKVLMEAPNVLFLDEPTNDLDIETLTVLEDYLDNFNGAVICVSHDRYFLDRTVNKMLGFEGNGEIISIVGNYEDYKDYKESIVEEKNNTNKLTEIGNNKVIREKKDKTIKFTFKEQKEFEQIDGFIEAKERELEVVNEKINNSGSDFVQLQQLIVEQDNIKKELELLMERWTYLNELDEQIRSLKNQN